MHAMRFLRQLSLVAPLIGFSVGCSKSPASRDSDASRARVTSGTPSPSSILDVVGSAEDGRRAKDVPAEARTSHDVVTRRRSARALSRIADVLSVEGLSAHLADADPETMTWAAYGLGYACKGREDAHVKMLAARSASLGSSDARAARVATRGASELDPRTAIARAIGRCGGSLAEPMLVALLKGGGSWAGPAMLGLGDLATRRKHLGAEAMTALLDEASSDRAGADTAFYALSRAEPGDAFGKRVVQAASSALGRESESRLFAIKTLGRADRESAREGAADLLRVVTDTKHFNAAERAEAARALGTLHEAGQIKAAEALGRLVTDMEGAAVLGLLGPEFNILLTLVGSVGSEPPKTAEPALRALSNLVVPSPKSTALGRRVAELRCASALGLARGAFDAEVLRKCDDETSEISQRARLASLLRRPLSGDRRAVFRVFTKSEHVRVQEAAVEAIAQHPELSDSAATILAEALMSKKPGLVATAASVIDSHPDRAMVLALREKRAALDPGSAPPTASPARELSHEVSKALSQALASQWPEDRFETRMGLMEASAAVRHPEAKAAAMAGCADANVVVRERAQKALRTLGEKAAECGAPEATLGSNGFAAIAPAKVVFTLDVESLGPLTIALEPELSPVTVARLKVLVQAGFYRGIVMHRVVPGFVVQFGDPDGDGYGGSGTPLRCETSPVPFGAFDVGMALAGRDTGSSQLFVTLSRTPHLDGEYTRVGRAEGAWSHVAQGDAIVQATLIE